MAKLLLLSSSSIIEQPTGEESLLDGSVEFANEWYAIAKIAHIRFAQAIGAEQAFDALLGARSDFQLVIGAA